jgi:hypothetical protein
MVSGEHAEANACKSSHNYGLGIDVYDKKSRGLLNIVLIDILFRIK